MTETERRLRVMLDRAAPEPTTSFDGPSLRDRAVDSRGPRRRWPAVVSGVAVAAAVVAVSLILHAALTGDHRSATPAAHRSPAASHLPSCASDDITLAFGGFSKGTATLRIEGRSRLACDYGRVPSISVASGSLVESRLSASRYQPSSPIAISRDHPLEIAVRIRTDDRDCRGRAPSPKQVLTFEKNGFSYSFPLIRSCSKFTILGATVIN